MGYLLTTLLTIFLFSLISALTCIVTVPLYLVIRKLKSQYWTNLTWITNKRAKIILTTLTLVFSVYQTYTAFYPTESFYKSEFAYNTKIEFPEDGEILVKGSTYPDIHGDYSASTVFQVDKQAITKIIEDIDTNSNFKKDTMSFNFGADIRDYSKKFDEKLFKLNYYWNLTDSKTYYFNIAFDTTNNLVAFDRVTW